MIKNKKLLSLDWLSMCRLIRMKIDLLQIGYRWVDPQNVHDHLRIDYQCIHQREWKLIIFGLITSVKIDKNVDDYLRIGYRCIDQPKCRWSYSNWLLMHRSTWMKNDFLLIGNQCVDRQNVGNRLWIGYRCIDRYEWGLIVFRLAAGA